MERMSSSEDTLPDHIKILDENNGTFKVRSQDDPTRSYTISFGSDSSPVVSHPSCDCYDWERYRLPCKHFFAIFRNVPAWSFNKLPKSYTGSQFLTVDSVGFQASNIETPSNNDANPPQPDASQISEESDAPPDPEFTSSQLPQKPTTHRTDAARCRERLSQIKNLTYVAEGWENANVLIELKEMLDKCYQLLTDASPKENGLVLEVRKTKKPDKRTNQYTNKTSPPSHFKSIPRPLKKNPGSGRSGERAATLKRSYVSSLNQIEEPPTKILRANSNIIAEELPNSPPKSSHDKSEEIILEKVAHTVTTKRGNFKINDTDVNLIITRKELTDHIIAAAHTVLHKQFPTALGLENTTLGPVLNFSLHRGEFSQILHTGTHHWLLVSNIGCKPASINLYDSMYHERISMSTKSKLLACFLRNRPQSPSTSHTYITNLIMWIAEFLPLLSLCLYFSIKIQQLSHTMKVQ